MNECSLDAEAQSSVDGLAFPDEKGSVFSLRSQDLLAPLSADGPVVEEQIHVLHHISLIQSAQSVSPLHTQELLRNYSPVGVNHKGRKNLET